MSQTLPEQDTSTPAPQPSLDSARQAHPKIPLRARLSLLRQRIILTIRFFLRPLYHLPIDDVKEAQLERALKGLMQNDRNFLQGLNDLIATHNQLQRRVLYYEKHIPRMRELMRKFDREEEMLKMAAEAPQRETTERAAHGILEPKTNGHRRLIEVVRP